MSGKFLLVLFYLVTFSNGDKNERRLYRALMKDYQRLERPVSNGSHAVTIGLGVILQQLVDVDEKNQQVTVNCWLKYTWRDHNLKWNPEEYGGLVDLRFPAIDFLWKPDILLYNSVDTNFDSTYPTNMVVYSDGTISWIPPGIFKISCKIDITFFPFDEQHCYFKFGSWTYDGTKVDLQAGDFDMSEYLENGEWSLSKATVKRMEKFYDCCPEPYPDLKFYMHMRRRTLYFAFNLMTPCIMITWLTICGFMLPPDAGEKVGLQVTVLLAICFFLNIVAEMSPPTSEAMPLLGVFFSCCMLIVTASCVCTVFILNLHHRSSGTHAMGHFTRVMLLHWIPFLLFMDRPGYKLRWKSLPPIFTRKETEDQIHHKKTSVSFQYNDRSTGRRIETCLATLFNNQPNMTCSQQYKLIILQGMFREIKYITKRMANEDEESYVKSEWKFTAMVVDRLCMIILAICITVSILFICVRAPYLIV